MLSAKELFKYRTGLEQIMPPKGGDKEYLPDGSWLQDKCIESFNRERERVLSEPRVVRSHDLVKGEWKPDIGLLELFHEMRNFWEHMGFVDKKRKWLYPEEALFLIETGVLEMWYQGLPVSIQEAYSTLIGEKLQLEYYQVYAHLRRIGYVVLRHQGRYAFTKYERQIALDKHVSHKKKRNKEKRNKAIDQSNDAAHVQMCDQSADISKNRIGNQSENLPDYKTNRSDDDHKGRICDQSSDRHTIDISEDKFDAVSTDGAGGHGATRNIVEQGERNQSKRAKTDDLSNNVVYQNFEPQSSDSLKDNLAGETQTKTSKWNFDEIKFPDFKNSEERVSVQKPDVKYIPQDHEVSFCESEYSFEKKQYINTKKLKKKQQILDEALVQELDFSYPEIMTGWHKVKKSCTSWKEYKMAVKKEKASWDRSTIFPHLYGDKVKPLVKPELARSTCAVLEQLRVVEDDVQKKCDRKPDIVPDFDVYAPNTKFKKTKPGIPDFRVKVTRTSDPVPDLKLVNSIDSYLNDEASLQWAVVDGGNIAFYCMSDMPLPQDISLG
ncbi:tRNA-splicing endonuclease subunit Sen54-like [Mercenaria mercenaria]|uniref:tRNA-splicing endonuclease subunit Sen54-like n=1 Tax=Mercenaria mercenaria TaxID=6596 RepID=UPI00234F485C|nr:tRNA-splicing endonuclease subunit Sen54-like [Mercenaria mercenaria]